MNQFRHLCPGCQALVRGAWDLEVWITDARHGLCEKCAAAPPEGIAKLIARQAADLGVVKRAGARTRTWTDTAIAPRTQALATSARNH